MLVTSVRAADPKVPKVSRLAETLLSDQEMQELVGKAPAAEPSKVSSPFPPRKVELPRAGGKNALGMEVGEDLARAYAAYARHDGDEVLASLARIDKPGAVPLARWHYSFLRAQTFLTLGRAADAEEELRETATREIALWGSDLNARALRGEAKLWLADYRGALQDYARVWQATKDWRLPVSYSWPPGNIPELVGVTTAQMRAMTGIAGVFLLQGEPARALGWAEAVEQRFNDVHYLATHWLYGRYIAAEPDSYFGRASNYSFLGAARLANGAPIAEAEKAFAAAAAFYEAVQYPSGRVIAESLMSWGLHKRGETDRAIEVAERMVELAGKQGLADLIWRVEILRGAFLYDKGDAARAEEAFRRAQASVESVTSSLASDRSKLRFGAGKEEIAYRLTRIDAARGDLSTLFRDMERGRARAFVDMLAGRVVAPGREAELVEALRRVDRDLLRERLRRAAPASGVPVAEAVEKLEHERKLLSEKLFERDPEIAEVFAVGVRDLRDIQSALRKGEVLAYWLPYRDDDPMSALLVSSEGARLLQTELKGRELDRMLADFRRAVALQLTPRQKEIADKLGIALRVRDWGAGMSGAYVVPTGSLHYVPWMALDIDLPVAVVPNGAWVARRGENAEGKPAVVVGDPELGGVLPQLTGARDEAQAIAKLVGGATLIGAAATEQALRDRIGDGASLLHLATHGRFEPDAPLDSAVYLSEAGKAKLLTAADLFARPLRARYVVLSACESGLGEAVAGDDYLGLARSFYLAGARAVLHSLWQVEDTSTQMFMVAFQTELQSGSSKGNYGAAILKARDTLRSAGLPPWMYGAFVLGGALRD